MQELYQYQNNLLGQINNDWFRYLLSQLHTKERLLGIKGLRGVGKTTLFLQYLRFYYPRQNEALYVTADHPYFYTRSLMELAQEFYQLGGKLLLIDEIHKYPDWSRELKLIYDGHPDLQLFFTSSSALNLFKGESDLSRRLIVQELHGLSFREFLNYRHGLALAAYSLEDILHNHQEIAQDLTRQFKVIPLFRSYLKTGYFPFIKVDNDPLMEQRIIQVVNTIIESDLATIKDYSARNVQKIKKLLGVIAESPPFEPNISKLAEKLSIGRNTAYQYIYELADALLIRNVNRAGHGISRLQKPDKIYFENTTLAYALSPDAQVGSMRETFFANQIHNAGHKLNLAPKGDFIIDNHLVFEVGGKNKKQKQIAGMEDAYLIKDDIEIGVANTIPLWLFGFLY